MAGHQKEPVLNFRPVWPYTLQLGGFITLEPNKKAVPVRDGLMVQHSYFIVKLEGNFIFGQAGLNFSPA